MSFTNWDEVPAEANRIVMTADQVAKILQIKPKTLEN